MIASVADDREGDRVTTNLAWSLAQAGSRVLLIDADLRRSVVGDSLGIDPGPGLADILAGRAGLPAVVRATNQPGLRVVLSGTPQSGPSDLLSTPVLASLLQRAEHEHDFVILQVPSVLSCSDAAAVAAVAGGTLLTVAMGGNRVQHVTSALAALANVGVVPLGLVLTGAPQRKGDSSGGGHPRIPIPLPMERRSQARPMPRPAQP